jgi:RHS repeat-associated protein
LLSRSPCAPKICAPNDHLNTVSLYDYRNRLTEVEQAGTIIATYVYNALDQRIGIDDNGSQTWTVYNGTSADALPYADFNGSGALLTRYVSGPGMVNGAVVDELLARTSSGGSSAWYLTDKLDSVHDIVSSSGTELDHVVYDSFGNILTETNASNGDRFKFAGMEYDPVAGELYDRARDYSTALGRFVSQDPLEFSGGNSNLYLYITNQPTRTTDPGGMMAQPPPFVPILIIPTLPLDLLLGIYEENARTTWDGLLSTDPIFQTPTMSPLVSDQQAVFKLVQNNLKILRAELKKAKPNAQLVENLVVGINTALRMQLNKLNATTPTAPTDPRTLKLLKTQVQAALPPLAKLRSDNRIQYPPAFSIPKLQ